MKTLPYTIDIPGMSLRLRAMASPAKQIKILLQLQDLSEAGVLPRMHVVQMMQNISIKEDDWRKSIDQASTEHQIMRIGKTIGFYQIAGMLTVSPELRILLNNKLEKIHKETL